MAYNYDVIVIGGGAAGMMAAGRAAERGRRVLLLEKNKVLGKKLAITGGGRCNVCNAEENIHLLLAHYGNAKKFLFSPFSQFGVAETFNFFASRGLPLKVEAEKRAFPRSERASDVVKVLVRYLKEGGVEIKHSAQVNGFAASKGKITGVKLGKSVLRADSYILATGGKSHPETGSTGDGFAWVSDIGHTSVQPTPTIVPIAVSDAWVKSLAGTTLQDVKITFFANAAKEFALTGNILCTHFGLSGPLILNAAGKVADLLYKGRVSALIDLFPKRDAGALDTDMRSVFELHSNRSLKNAMKEILSAGLASAVVSGLPALDGDRKVHSLTRQERKLLGMRMKSMPVSVTGLMGFERAVVADGGVPIDELEAKTMRSRKHPNLFVTGDLLHINRPSGGYSLQLCWTTGWVAGNVA